MRWTDRGSNPRRGKIIFSIPHHPDRFRVPPSSLLNEYRDCFRSSRGRGVILTKHHYPVPKLRMSGAIHLLPQYAFTTRTRTALPFIKLNHILTLIMSDHIILNFKLPHNGDHVREAARPPFSQYSAYLETQNGRTLLQSTTFGI